jgi:HEPN domain-containing protein
MNKNVANWLTFAEEDLHSAKILFRESIYNKVCFHSQQCVENSLKALLVFYKKTCQ